MSEFARRQECAVLVVSEGIYTYIGDILTNVRWTCEAEKLILMEIN